MVDLSAPSPELHLDVSFRWLACGNAVARVKRLQINQNIHFFKRFGIFNRFGVFNVRNMQTGPQS